MATMTPPSPNQLQQPMTPVERLADIERKGITGPEALDPTTAFTDLAQTLREIVEDPSNTVEETEKPSVVFNAVKTFALIQISKGADVNIVEPLLFDSTIAERREIVRQIAEYNGLPTRGNGLNSIHRDFREMVHDELENQPVPTGNQPLPTGHGDRTQANPITSPDGTPVESKGLFKRAFSALSLSGTRKAYDLKAAKQRKVNSLDETDPQYKVAVQELQEAKNKLRGHILGATSVSAAAGAVAEGVFVASERVGGRIPTALAAGALSGYAYPKFQTWREKKNVSQDQRREIIEWKEAEIEGYRADKTAIDASYNFDEDQEYQELLSQKDMLTPKGLRDKLSTKYAELGAKGTVSALGFIENTKRKLLSGGFARINKKLDWSDTALDSDVVDGRNALIGRLERLMQNIPEAQWGESDDITAARNELDEYEHDAVDEFGVEEGGLRPTKKGAGVAAGVLFLAAATGIVANKYGHNIWGKDGIMHGGNKSGQSDTVTSQTSTPGGGSGRHGDVVANSGIGKKGASSVDKITQHVDVGGGKPKIGSQDWYEKLSTGEKNRFKHLIDTTESFKAKNPGASSAQINKMVEGAVKLGAKRDEYINRGGANPAVRQVLAQQFDENFRRFVEEAAKLKTS